MKVADLMTTDVLAASPDQTLKDAARALASRGISGLPVVGSSARVLGVLSEADILAKEVDGGARVSALQRFLEGPPVDDRFNAMLVEEAMTAPAITIAPERPITEAAGMMLAEGINRLPVVDDEGRLIGIISRGDLVRAFAQDDETIRAEIVRTMREDLWLDPARIELTVTNGVVELGGELASEDEARILATFARRVPGVVEVNSTVRAGR
ncbi:MAG: CBS domain-containing protein [Gaiella sp.]